MFEKHLWKSDILIPQVFFKYFACKNQLVEN